jgi:hypothetical protein
VFGAEEVLGDDARQLISWLRGDVAKHMRREQREGGVQSRKQGKGRGAVVVTEQEKQVHAWPVVQLFLGTVEEERLGGLRRIVDVMVDAMAGNRGGGRRNGSVDMTPPSSPARRKGT